MNTIITSSLTHTLTHSSIMCVFEYECETSTYKQSEMIRVEKLMNALVGWMVLTAVCIRIRIQIRILMKSFAQERVNEREGGVDI